MHVDESKQMVQAMEKSFSVADYTVFVGMLLISSSIGVYYAWTVSVDC